MKRREFISLLGGATAAWPLAARAQQSERKRRVGVLMGLVADDAEAQDRIAAFEQGLQQLGWTNGRNLQVDYRRGAGDTGSTRRYADELVALAPDVILASGGTVVGALLQATRTVPIVFTQTPDPVAAGFVASLARPGGTLNNGATIKLFVNGALAGEGSVGSAMVRQGIEPFEIGRDSISPVSPDYKAKGAFPFTGTIEKIQFDATP